MPKVDETKESEIKREIRIAIAKDPMISLRRLQMELQKKGIQTSNGTVLDSGYLSKLIRKITREQVQDIDNDEIKKRLSKTRERFDLAFQRLFKIAFWEWGYLSEGIMMPTVMEQVAAINTILKMDIALLEAEMDAGIFQRQLGTLEVERRNKPLAPETKQAILGAFERWGLMPPETRKVESIEIQPSNAISTDTTEQTAG